MCSLILSTYRFLSATYCTYQGTYSMGRISLHTRISTNSRCNFHIRIFRILGYEHLTFILCVSISTKQGCVFQHTYTSNVKFTFTSFDIGINSYVIYTRISWISLCTKFECKFNIWYNGTIPIVWYLRRVPKVSSLHVPVSLSYLPI